ncbi:MAG: GAF domain-containing protein [Myxococcaceae bacterium]|nr:GAF domain-containing protein [Myxococcaceae bacterium]
MPLRIDALENRDRDWSAYSGDVLSVSDDPRLQAIVQQLAAELDVPMATVTLVLQRVGLFRAHFGLSGDLDRLRGMDRDVTFCQFVVRDGERFEVKDAAVDDRVPKTLVETFGVRSYVGFPVKVGPTVVGSLCGADVKPRTFTPAQAARIEELAGRVSERLTELASHRDRVPASAVASAMQPALAELRNVLSPLVSGVSVARIAAEELKLVLRAQGALPEWASHAGEAANDLGDVLGDMSEAADRVRPILHAVQRMVGEATRATTADETVRLAVEIAQHHLRHVGGAKVGEAPADTLRAPVGVAVSIVAALLSTLGLSLQSAGLRSGVSVRAERTGAVVTVHVSTALPPAQVQRCVDEVAGHFPDHDPALSASGSAVAVVFQLA